MPRGGAQGTFDKRARSGSIEWWLSNNSAPLLLALGGAALGGAAEMVSWSLLRKA